MSDNNNENYCSICHRPESETGPQVSMPGGMHVCNECMQKSFDAFSNGDVQIPGMGQVKLDDLKDMDWKSFLPKELADLLEGIPGLDAGVSMIFPGMNMQMEAEEPEEADEEEEAVALPAETEEEADGENEDAPVKKKPAEPKKPADKPKKKKGLNMMFLNPFGGGPDQQLVKRKTAEEKEAERQAFDLRSIPAPHQIKSQLDEYVVGQEKAKKVISVAVYNHYKRIYSDPSDGIEIEKSNLLLLGPTGSGKTYLVKTLAKLLDVPLAIADATSLTEAGYIGDDIESVLSKLLAAADNDVDRAEHGIVFIDEIDKIAKKKNMTSRDVSGESVQQELLKMLEGSRIEVPVGGGSKMNMMTPTTPINTDNILFICGGAFPELSKIIKERLTKNNSIGFGAEVYDLNEDTEGEMLSKVTIDDLRTFGMIPEFLGRLPIIVTLDSLSDEFLARILTEPKNAIVKQYQKLFAMDEVKLDFETEALLIIARRALKKETGARALRAVLEEFMQDIMYEVPKDPNIGSVTITADYLEHKGGPLITFRGM